MLLALGLLVGAVVGKMGEWLAIATMPWLTMGQRDLVFPCFVFLGLVLGVFAVAAEAMRGNLSRKSKP